MTRKSTSLTIRDIAKYAGVSVATVSRYMNNSGPVSQEVGERISQVMLDLNYTPHVIARQLATERTRAVGLVITNVMNDFFAPLVNGVFSVTTENNYNLLVAVAKPGSQEQKDPSPIGPHNTDGTLVFANGLSDEQLADLCKFRFPIVLLYRTPPPNLRIPCVVVENKASTQKLIDHLIDVHGRKRILFFRGMPDQEDSHWRELGYRKSLAAHGLPIDERLILCGEFEHKVAYRTMQEYLAAGNRDFDGVFTGNDDAAVGILTALREAGVRVPEDVSVAGFDDFRLSRFLNPPLTTVQAPTEKVGYTAAEQLSKIFQGEPIKEKILLPTELVLRRSCGCDYQSSSLLNLP
ncbi:MAG TPA: LacI family DNA-binding transcriptional regulator [Anaerolineales bacterium]|nr:LacI family DNA-binding transcriptional regulator [Anaerolineales bacterium]